MYLISFIIHSVAQNDDIWLSSLFNTSIYLVNNQMQLLEYRLPNGLSLTLIDIKPYSEHYVNFMIMTIDESIIVNTHETFWLAQSKTITVIYDTSID